MLGIKKEQYPPIIFDIVIIWNVTICNLLAFEEKFSFVRDPPQKFAELNFKLPIMVLFLIG